MKCSKCGKDYQGNFCPNCGTRAPGNVDSVSPKKKKFHWWYVLIALIVLGAIGSLGNGSNDAEEQDQTQTVAGESEENVDEETTQAPAPSKETAQSNDLKIYTTLEMAQRYLSVLQENIAGMESGSSSLLDVYDTCEDLKTYMGQYDDHLDEVDDPSAEAYKEAVHGYLMMLWGAADDLIKYIDDGEMEDLSRCREEIEALPAYAVTAASERVTYLSNAGFTDEEIQSILEDSASEEE